jgi:CRP-like cAMP-binding protein
MALSALFNPTRIATEQCKNVDPLRGLSAVADSTRRILSYHRDQEIYGPNVAEEHWFCVLSGAARKYVLMADGRRRIIDFLLPGDFFGFRARHEAFFSADAMVAGTEVARYPRRGVEMAADSNTRLAREIREVTFESISRSQARLLILGCVTSMRDLAREGLRVSRRNGTPFIRWACECGGAANVALRYRRLSGGLGRDREQSIDRT